MRPTYAEGRELVNRLEGLLRGSAIGRGGAPHQPSSDQASAYVLGYLVSMLAHAIALSPLVEDYVRASVVDLEAVDIKARAYGRGEGGSQP